MAETFLGGYETTPFQVRGFIPVSYPVSYPRFHTPVSYPGFIPLFGTLVSYPGFIPGFIPQFQPSCLCLVSDVVSYIDR